MSEVIVDTEGSTDAPLPDEPQAAVAAPDEQINTEAPSAPETDEQKNARAKNGVEKRIGELTYKANEAQRRHAEEAQKRAYVESELMEVKRQMAQVQAYTTAPQLNQYQSAEQWQAAVMQHSQEVAQRQVAETLQQLGMTPQQQQAKAQNDQANQYIAAKIADASQKYPDIVARITNPQLPDLGQLNPAVREALVTSPAFADLAYHLSSNPQEAWRIAQLHPAQAVMELGALAGKIGNGPRVSNAPAPPRELGTSESVTKDPAKMSMNEYRAWRKSQR